MLLLSLSSLVLILSVESSHGFFNGRHGSGRLPMCPSRNKPCRLRVSISDASGTDLDTIGTGTCTCSPPFTCSDDWTKERHVISRRIISTNHNMTLQMMFCNPIEPRHYCEPGQISLVVKGSLAMPQDIDSYNCRCRRPQPLILRERSIGEDNLIYHSYACAGHVEPCERTSPCMEIHHTRTDYHCRCMDGFQCRIPENLWGTETSHGYCSP